jgi:hypothetical protein
MNIWKITYWVNDEKVVFEGSLSEFSGEVNGKIEVQRITGVRFLR